MSLDRDLFLNKIIKHEQETIIYGSGMFGKNVRFFLQDVCGIAIDFFCDKNSQLWGTVVEGNLKCISLEELLAKKDDCNIIIAVAYRYLDEVKLYFKQNHVKNYITWLEIIRNNWLKRKFCGVGHIESLKGSEKGRKSDQSLRKARKGRVAVYTFITDGYDRLHQPLVIDKNADYFVISDQKIDDLGVFHWIDVNFIVPSAIEDPFMKNRYCKMHGADIFKDYEYSIYLDGAVQIAGNIISYLDQVGKTGIALYLNETNGCIYDAGILLTLVGRCSFEMTRKQLRLYALEGMPENYGFLCGGYIFRDNRNALGNELMNLWWEEYRKWKTRDQLCLPYVMWKMGVELQDIGIINAGQNRLEDKNFIHHSHCSVKFYSPSKEDNCNVAVTYD